MEGATAPLDYLLGIMRDRTRMPARVWTLPKAAAPYCHARLLDRIERPQRRPSVGADSQKLDISGLNDEELDILERALQKRIALQEKC
jgi:hypothetical protein